MQYFTHYLANLDCHKQHVYLKLHHCSVGIVSFSIIISLSASKLFVLKGALVVDKTTVYTCAQVEVVPRVVQMMESPKNSDLIVDRDMAPKFAEIYSFLQLFHGHLEIQPVSLAELEDFFGEGTIANVSK